MARKCKNCGKSLTGKRKYCNDKCYRKYNNQRSAGPKKLVCKRCGQNFESFQGGAKYCSTFCKEWHGFHECEICGRKCNNSHPLCKYCKAKKKNSPIKIKTVVRHSFIEDTVWPEYSGIPGIKTTDASYAPFR